MDNATQNKRVFSSKLNKIFTNLEKSIINQFGSASDLRRASKSASKKTEHSLNPANPARLIHTNTNSSSTLKKSTFDQKDSVKKSYSNLHNERTNDKDKVSAANNELNFRLNHRKLTLDGNKQQQNGHVHNTAQFISNPVLIHRNSYNGGISYVNNMNTINRLSIPPPHANDEARNQTHKLLFGANAVNDSNLSYESRAQSNPHSVSRVNEPFETNTRDSNPKHGTDINSGSDNINGSNQAKSLNPQDVKNQQNSFDNYSLSTKHRSQVLSSSDENHNKTSNTDAKIRTQNIDEKDIEESGFTTYQSRRSQFGSTTNQLNGNGEHDPESRAIDKNNGNLKIPSRTQAQNQNDINNMTMHHVLANNYNGRAHLIHPDMNGLHIRQHQENVMLGNYRPDQRNCYTNSGHMNLPHQVLGYGDIRRGSTMSMVTMDDGQQIYANAPPKPLRYQYYDAALSGYPYYPSWTYHLAHLPTMSVPFNNMNLVPSINHQQFNSQYHPQRQLHSTHLGYRQEIQQARPMFDNTINLPMQPRDSNFFRLQSPQNVINKRDSTSVNYFNNQPTLPYLPKSKSSLDARDLINFRTERMLQTNDMKSSQRHPFQSRPFEPSSGFSSRIQNFNPESYTQQSNLQRSKSVSHLLADSYDCGGHNTMSKTQLCYLPNMNSNFATVRRNQHMVNCRDNSKISLSQLGNTRSSISATNLNMLCTNNNNHNFLPSHYLSNEAESDSALSSKNSDCAFNDTMGNKNSGQYIVSRDSKFSGQLSNRNQNSQLIVDLTTPRVLAKTQTKISSNSSENKLNPSEFTNGSMDQSSSETSTIWSSSINQVGLPHVSESTDSANTGSKSTSSGSTSQLTNNEPSLDWTILHSSDQFSASAPYYYSDLESEEQRTALQNIFEQKNLSPPPQLLSRSTDQSSTRLAPKSATPHLTRVRQPDELVPQVLRSAQSVTCNIPQLF